MSEEIENKEFDKIVEQKYAQHNPPVPDHLYANIDKEVALMEADSLRKRIFWYRWISIALLFITTSVVLFYQWDNITTSNTISENKINENIPVLNNNKEITSDLDAPSEQPTAHNNQELSMVEATNATEEKKIEINSNSSVADKSISNSEKKKTNPSSAVQVYVSNKQKGANIKNTPNDELITKKENTTSTNKLNSATNATNNALSEAAQEAGLTPKTSVNNQIEDNNPAAADNSTNESASSLEETTAQNNKTNNTVNPPVIDKPSSSIKSTDTNKTPSYNNEITEEINTVTNAEQEQPIDSIFPVASILESDSSFKDTTATIVAVNEMDSSSQKTLSKFSASLFIIPTLTNRGLSPSNNSHKIYDALETTEPGLSFGAAIGYLITNKLTLNLGISYHQFKSTIELNDQRPKDLPITMNPSNKSITVFSALGTVLISNIGSFEYAGDDQDDQDLDDEDDFASLNYKEEQEYVFLDIPLTIGYEFGKGKFKLILQTGIVTSLLIKDKAEISISNIHHPDVFVTANDFSQSNQLSFGGTVGIGAKYNIGKRFSILFIPSYNQTITDINKDESTAIKPISTDFRTGLQFNF